jgi:prephenate dehydratase
MGVIASELAAELYGLEKVECGIEDYKHNYTRFFVIGKGNCERQKGDTRPYKTSVIFALPDKPGALLDCLEEFGKRNINLSKL